MDNAIKKEHFFDFPIGQVWQAISNEKEISAWFIKADFKAEVGYQYTFTHENTAIKGEVLKAEPVHHLVYTWVVSGTEAITTVKWALEEKEQGTLLTIEHSGLDNYPTETAINMFNSFSKGWDNCIEELDKYLVKEKVV